jgi:phage portal protein BeeE
VNRWLRPGGLRRPVTADSAGPAVTAAAGRVALAGRPSSRATVPWGLGPPLQPVEWDGVGSLWFDRDAAMSLPTISRCRDLICSAGAALPFTLWTVDASRIPVVEQQIPGCSWFQRPDPNRTRQWLLAWTIDDLLFYERAHWLVTDRYATTFPSSFERIAPGNLEVRDDQTAVVTDDHGRQRTVPARDVIEFLSPIEGLLSNGVRPISIALQLDAAADRFAGTELPTGVLQEQEGSEDMDSDELAEQADRFTAARLSNTTAALNKYLRYESIDVDASKMQLVEARTYQALELARLGNTPPYLVGAPAGTGMTYQNGQQARTDLIDFGAGPYIGCIEQTLSGPNVTPRGQSVRLDLNAWLRNPFVTTGDGAAAEESPNDMQIADPTGPDVGVPG